MDFLHGIFSQFSLTLLSMFPLNLFALPRSHIFVVLHVEHFDGLVIVNKIMRYEVFEQDEQNVYITVGAGENWDSVVERSVGAGLTGIEALSLIPGTAGATPVQNVGAYGQEIAQTLTVVEAYDTQAKTMVNLQGAECGSFSSPNTHEPPENNAGKGR